MTADLRCYPAVICRGFLNVSYVISKAWETGDIGIDQNSETAALVAALAQSCRGDLPMGSAKFTT